MNNDNFDLVLAIPCNTIRGKVIEPTPEMFYNNFCDNSLKYNEKEFKIKNAAYDNKSNILEYAKIFCERIEKHSEYELIFSDESSNITFERKPMAFGQVIIYNDELNDDYTPQCCYNFFAVLSNLFVKKLTLMSSEKSNSSFNNHIFNIVYFVVPDINYHDLTLLMDQSHELWCHFGGKIDSNSTKIFFLDYLKNNFGYKYFGKIYHIIFSDINQFEAINDIHNKGKLFNILAAEEYKDKFSHQIELSDSTNEYIYSDGRRTKNFTLSKKEKFYDDYNMYSSYKAYASIYAYYYIINEEDKDLFWKRISPDPNNQDFSSEGNILFILENEIFKITACLVSSMEIYEQINNPIPNMVEIQNMFRHFINTRPLFEKLNYRYLGAQVEADFIFQQFRINDMFADYDRKRELLKNYCEVNNSIISNKNAIILSLMGLLFAFITGWDKFSLISTIFNAEFKIIWDIELIIQTIIWLFVFIMAIIVIQPVKRIKKVINWLKAKK
ncbi:hypothetical protein R84B8_01001 [Treponema sp. R8-4-B8]